MLRLQKKLLIADINDAIKAQAEGYQKKCDAINLFDDQFDMMTNSHLGIY